MVISHPHGIANEYWGMRSPTSPDIMVDGLSMKGSDTETSFDITYPNCSLQPFDDPATYGKSFKDRLLLVEGLDLAADGHDATATILTGSRLNGGQPANSSLDQFLAVEKGLGAATKKSNIVLSVGSTDLTAANALSFSAGGVGVGKIISPFDAFDFLFGSFVPVNDAAGQAALKRKNALGQSVIDYVRADVNRLTVETASDAISEPSTATTTRSRVGRRATRTGTGDRSMSSADTDPTSACVTTELPRVPTTTTSGR